MSRTVPNCHDASIDGGTGSRGNVAIVARRAFVLPVHSFRIKKGNRVIMKNKFAALTFATLLLFAAGLAGCGPKKPELSAADQRKIAALNLAFKSGVLTQQEYDAKLKAINDGAVAANSPSSNGASTAATAQ